MTARTHDLIAFASLVTVATNNPPESLNLLTLGAAVVGNVVGSLMPDLDQAGNKLWDLVPGGDYVGKILSKFFFGHRAFSHSLIGFYVIMKITHFLLIKLLNPNYVNAELVFTAVMIGYASHLVADAITKDGLPLLFPLKWKFGFPPISAFRVTTGSWVENLLVFPGTAAYIFWFIGKNQGQILDILRQLS